MSLSETYISRKQLIADNLNSMGVSSASVNDGLTTLAGKILDIEPSIGGLDLDTALSLSASPSNITVGESVVFSSKLTASYDDETLVDVDLTGVLTGATVLLKEGNNTVGSGVTGSDGIVSVTVSDLTVGTHTVKAVFSGTDNFHACESSSVSVVVSEPLVDSISLVEVNGKSVLSFANSDSASMVATVFDSSSNPLSGQTVSMGVYKVSDDSLVESLSVTDEGDGTYSATYNSQGVGDVYVKAECMLVSEDYSIHDKLKYDKCDADKTSNYNFTDTLQYDSTEQAYKLTATSTGGNPNLIAENLPNKVKYSCDFKLVSGSNLQPRLELVDTSTEIWYILNKYNNKIMIAGSASVGNVSANLTINTDVYYTLEVIMNGIDITYRVLDSNGNQLATVSKILSSALSDSNVKARICPSYTNGMVMYFKNINIEAL